jgi:hypothetical protein
MNPVPSFAQPRQFDRSLAMVASFSASAAMLLLTGCAGLQAEHDAVRTVGIEAFSQAPPAGLVASRTPSGSTSGSAMPAEGDADSASGPLDASEGSDGVETPGRASNETRPTPGNSAGSSGPVAQPAPGPVAAARDAAAPPAREQRWVVDALVGQINGRPIFADEFFQPLEASLERLAAAPDRALARQQMVELVSQRFTDWVNSELVISEAESSLTPEQQQGLFGWLRTVQEGTIAEYAGSREEARERMRDDLGMDFDEFVQQRRDAALAQFLLDRKVKPRTIVSWRDIEREYTRRSADFNPPAMLSIGSIALDGRSDAERIAQVRAWAEAGRNFTEIAKDLGLEKNGIVVQVPLAPGQSAQDAIAASADIAPAVKERLRDLAPGMLSQPIERGSRVTWLAIGDVSQMPARSLFDPDVQMQLRNELDAIRSTVERSRYIGRLRSRWVSDDIKRIEDRLLVIALDRYFR